MLLCCYGELVSVWCTLCIWRCIAAYCSWCLLLQLLLLLAVSVYVVSAVSVYVFAVLDVVYYSCCSSFVYLRGQCCLISCCGSRCSLMWLLTQISVKRGAGTSPIQHLLFLTCLVNIATILDRESKFFSQKQG